MAKKRKLRKVQENVNTFDLFGLSDSYCTSDMLFTKVNGLSVPGRLVLVRHQKMELIFHTDIQENKNRSCCD